ncbi:MAG TPA: hypothetical protein VK106_01355 [Balneolaceae bacterium]|nr:hypothetical protein [Balneolaceae bacterium]
MSAESRALNAIKVKILYIGVNIMAFKPFRKLISKKKAYKIIKDYFNPDYLPRNSALHKAK